MKAIMTTTLMVLMATATKAQDYSVNPYAIFGDTTAVLTAELPQASAMLVVPIATDDSQTATAVFDFLHRQAFLYDNQGQLLVADTLFEGQKGIWQNVDPKAGDYPHVTPYGYCIGNPVRFTDLIGYEPTEKEAAYIADHVYGNKKELIGGWKEYFKGKGANGLKYGIYERKMESGQFEYVLAFAGTEIEDMDDIRQDISQFLGVGNASQYGQAVNIGRQFAALYNEHETTIVGHSLGGGLATVAGMSSGLPTITFNPAAISEFTKYQLSIQNSPTNKIVNYVVAGEPLSMFQRKMQMSLPGNTNVIFIGVKGQNPLSNSSKLHSISVFKQYFQK